MATQVQLYFITLDCLHVCASGTIIIDTAGSNICSHAAAIQDHIVQALLCDAICTHTWADSLLMFTNAEACCQLHMISLSHEHKRSMKNRGLTGS